MFGFKSLIILAVAVSAVVADIGGPPSDAEEVAKLPQVMQVFSKFCLSSRDLIESMREKFMEGFDFANYSSMDDANVASCDSMIKSGVEVRATFEEYKKTSLGEHTDFSNLELAEVPCATTTMLIEAENECKNFLQQAGKVH